MTSQTRLTIDTARPAKVKPVTITTARPVKAPKAIGLGANLSEQPAIPKPNRLANTALILGLGGLAFAAGVAITLVMHRPDLLELGAEEPVIELETPAPDEPEVARAATTFLGVAPAEASTAEEGPVKQELTNGIVLTPEQQQKIAEVLALANGEPRQHTPPTLSAAALTPPPIATHVVSQGETLGSIAARYYGTASAYTHIIDANAEVLANPDSLEIGVSLVIPAL